MGTYADLFMMLVFRLDTKPSEALSALISDKNLSKLSVDFHLYTRRRH